MAAISYGGAVSTESFDLPRLSFTASNTPSRVARDGVHVVDQGEFPVCTGAVTCHMVQLMSALYGLPVRDLSPAWSYLLAVEIVARREALPIVSQLSQGVPLAAALQAACEKGAQRAENFESPCDPARVWMEILGPRNTSWRLPHATISQNLASLTLISSGLPWHMRAFQLEPSFASVLGSLQRGFPVAVGMRIDPKVHEWMLSPTFQRFSAHVVPAPDLFSPRLATHAVVIVDYRGEEEDGLFTALNSFGKTWGIDGTFFIRKRDLLNIALTNEEFYILV